MHEEAFPAIRRSIEILEGLVASQPDQPRYHAMLGRAFWILGFLHDEDDDNARRCRPCCEPATRRTGRWATPRSPNSIGSTWPTSSGTWGSSTWTWDGSPTACRTTGVSVEIKRQLLAAHPQDRVRILDLAGQLAMLATVERHGGDSASARQSYGEAAALLEPLDPDLGDPDVQVPRADYLIGEAVSAADLGRRAQALPLLDRAVEILTPFGRLGAGEIPVPGSGSPRPSGIGRDCCGRRGAPARRIALDDESKALWKGRKAGELADLAMKETTEAARVGYGRVPARAGGRGGPAPGPRPRRVPAPPGHREGFPRLRRPPQETRITAPALQARDRPHPPRPRVPRRPLPRPRRRRDDRDRPGRLSSSI